MVLPDSGHSFLLVLVFFLTLYNSDLITVILYYWIDLYIHVILYYLIDLYIYVILCIVTSTLTTLLMKLCLP